MLDLRQVIDRPEELRAALARRSDQAASLLDPLMELGKRRRSVIGRSEALAAERNAASKAMASADKTTADFARKRESLKAAGAALKDLERELAEVEHLIEAGLAIVPNPPAGTVPVGRSSDDNVVVSSWGEKPSLDFTPKNHWDIGTELGILDFERAAKLSGPRFVVMMGLGARLERALIQFMLDLHTGEHGYTEVLPPFLVKDSALYGTGQLPKFEADLFKTRKSDPDKTYDLYLSPTAEVPLTNLHAEEILDGARLPIAYCAYTPCFRSEAGSYGADVRGMIRQHQFDKVELVRICRPEDSAAELEHLTGHAEEVLRRLGLHFRRVLLCTGDLGFSAQQTYDLEVWLPGPNAYREISSCSNCGEFQARRASIRYRPAQGDKPRLVHTLNGSGLAVGRTVIAILEQYQLADGSVRVPDALVKYMGSDRITGS